MLYPQSGDRIVAIDTVTSFHPLYMREVSQIKRHNLLVKAANCKRRDNAASYGFNFCVGGRSTDGLMPVYRMTAVNR